MAAALLPDSRWQRPQIAGTGGTKFCKASRACDRCLWLHAGQRPWYRP